jgi:hypothetical protein
MRSLRHTSTSQPDPVPHREPVPAHTRSVRPTVHDRVALDEIELYSELIIAAQRSDGRLSPETIDTVLGLRPPAPVGA